MPVKSISTRSYNDEEVKQMRSAGFITPKEAAERAGVNLSRVYRAIKAEVAKDARARAFKVRAGENTWNLYVHSDGFKVWIKERQARLAQQLGL